MVVAIVLVFPARIPALYIVALSIGLTCLILLVVFYRNRLKDRSCLIKLYSGECWAHWTYGTAAWSSYSQFAYAAARAELRGRWRRILMVFGLLAGGIAFGSLALAYSDSGHVPISFLVLSALLSAGIAAWILSEPWFLYCSLARSAPEARIGPHGLYHRGRYTSFARPYKLTSVEYKPGECPELIFSLQVKARFGWVPFAERVLVPSDRQGEAIALKERFREFRLDGGSS